MGFNDGQDRLSNASVGHLDMEHSADGGHDVADDDRLVGLPLLLVPSEEEERQVGIIGIPLSVGGTTIIVGDRPTEHLWTWNVNDIALTFGMASIDNTLADGLWDIGRCGLFTIIYIHQVGTLTSHAYDFILYGFGVEFCGVDFLVIKISEVDILPCNEFLHTELLHQCLVNGLKEFRSAPSAS